MKVAIIGAGACGLMLANRLEKLNIDYKIFNDGKIGRKILASGNGRCNITNANLTPISFHNNPIAKSLISYNNELYSFLNELKIYTKSDNEGRMYPISESSLSVLNALLKNINKVIDLHVTSISNNYINNTYGPFDYIVLAIGSNASLKQDLDYSLLSNLDIKFNKYYPSLIGLHVKEKIKELSGVRAKAKISLYENNTLLYTEAGEVIFKDEGISGICIMNASSYYARSSKENITLHLDFIENEDYDDYSCILNPKLFEYYKKNKFNIHNMILNINNTYDMEFAQVAHGGIDISEINDNLSLKKYNNIFVGGEMIDCDALCGGFNLSFAFLSAIRIGEALDEIRNNKH